MRKTRQQKNQDRRERRTRDLADAQSHALEGMEAVRSHGKIIFVTGREQGEETIGKSVFTNRQLTEIARHGERVRTEERDRMPRTRGELFFG